MFGMFWIAQELSNLMMGFNVRSSLPVKKEATFKFYRVLKSGTAGVHCRYSHSEMTLSLRPLLTVLCFCLFTFLCQAFNANNVHNS